MMKLEQFLQLVDPEFMPKKLNATFDEALANLIFFNDSDTIALYLFQDDYPTEQGTRLRSSFLNEYFIYNSGEF